MKAVNRCDKSLKFFTNLPDSFDSVTLLRTVVAVFDDELLVLFTTLGWGCDATTSAGTFSVFSNLTWTGLPLSSSLGFTSQSIFLAAFSASISLAPPKTSSESEVSNVNGTDLLPGGSFCWSLVCWNALSFWTSADFNDVEMVSNDESGTGVADMQHMIIVVTQNQCVHQHIRFILPLITFRASLGTRIFCNKKCSEYKLSCKLTRSC